LALRVAHGFSFANLLKKFSEAHNAMKNAKEARKVAKDEVGKLLLT
jgi:hypothetical protein